MPLIPAICDTCERVWVPNAIGLEGASSVRIENSRVSPCPYCGGVGHFPDGLYSATDETLRVVATSASSAESLERLRLILKAAQANNATADEVASSIAEQAPEYALLADVITRLRGVPIMAWLILVLTIVALAQADSTDRRLKAIEGKVDRVYQAIQSQAPPISASPTATPSAAANSVPKVGRNDLCPCGS